jgi:Flp pilus assembly protein TadG
VLVELALLLPLLVFLTLASVEFSLAIAAYKVLVNQVHSAARYLSTRAPGTGHIEAGCLLTHASLSSTRPCSGTALLPGFSASGFSVTVSDALNAPATHRSQRTTADATVTSATRINLVSVTATGYQHPLHFAGFLSNVVGSSPTLTFGPISSTMRQTL